ncbi:uncharacterized protein C19orf44 homolog [Carlito syrichta]|uniref:Uncharacterized protein C19orf44 homolog n=1 Tax=Carlito syrichta TaxID=1868482 RepID=A0A1U7T223_CARSF|nr:uncharacterized protein C19orf44 homolog [Carlito syrichta]
MTAARKASRSQHHIFGDFGDFSLEDSDMEGVRDFKISRSLTRTMPRQSRFFKRSQALGEKHSLPRENAVLGSGPRLAPGRPAATGSELRVEAALGRLARIEAELTSRMVPRSLSDTESDPMASEAGLPKKADKTPPGRAAGLPSQEAGPECPPAERKVSRFLKKQDPPAEKLTPGAPAGKERDFQTPQRRKPAGRYDFPDSDEAEVKALLGGSMETSRGKRPSVRQSIASTKVSKKPQAPLSSIPTQPRALSPPSAELSSPKPLQTSSLPSSQATDGPLCCAFLGGRSPQTPVSGGTALRSPPHSVTGTFSRSVFSELGPVIPVSSPSGSEAEPSEDSLSEDSANSLNELRVNLLSIEDLAPAIGRNADLEQEPEGAQRATPPSKGLGAQSPARQAASARAQARSSAFWGPATSAGGDDSIPTESEVSEYLSAGRTSAARPDSPCSVRASSEAPDVDMVSAAYSEDFESSPSPSVAEPVTRSREPRSRVQDALSEPSGLKTGQPPTPTSGKQCGQHTTVVRVKDTAVQTPRPACACRWTEAASVAAILPALGGAYVDPTPIASHVVSADAIEALTAYSPAALALNDMLRQQLILTQQFMEASRRQHASLLGSLDADSFHYHSLEEARQYIRRHKPTPLTMEDALEEAKQEL